MYKVMKTFICRGCSKFGNQYRLQKCRY